MKMRESGPCQLASLLVVLPFTHHRHSPFVCVPLVANRCPPLPVAETEKRVPGRLSCVRANAAPMPAPPADHLSPTRVKLCMPTLCTLSVYACVLPIDCLVGASNMLTERKRIFPTWTAFSVDVVSRHQHKVVGYACLQ